MKKEIVIFSRSLPHHGLGGMEVVAWDLAVEFVRLAYPVRVITTSIPGKGDEFQQEGVRVVPLKGTLSGRYTRSWWRDSRQYFIRHCMSTTLGIVSVSAAAFNILTLKNRLPNVPFIFQAHGTSWGEVISKWKSKRLRSLLSSSRNIIWLPKDMWAYRKFDAVVAVGEQVRSDFRRMPLRWGISERHVHLINNGVDTSVFHPSINERYRVRQDLRISESSPVVMSASRLHSQKGVAHGLKAFSKFLHRSPDAKYLIAGDGSERKYLETLAEDLNIASQVFFLGALKRDELASYLCSADVFLFLTDRVEVGMTLNVMEALACGLPCVVSGHLALPESGFITGVSQSSPSMVGIEIHEQFVKAKGQSKKSQISSYNNLSYSAGRYLELMGQSATS